MVDRAERLAVASQVLCGFVFWDPGALDRYEQLGLPRQLGYAATRSLPLAGAGHEAVCSAFFSIEPTYVRSAIRAVADLDIASDLWAARDDAIIDGLEQFARGCADALAEVAPTLWETVDGASGDGRVLFTACRSMSRPDDGVLSGWHALECLRQWRGDTHIALLIAADLDGVESSIIHSDWMGYDDDWIATSRGWRPDAIQAAKSRLQRRGLYDGRTATPAALFLRDDIESTTRARGADLWSGRSDELAEISERLEPFVTPLLERIDLTAGTRYVPAARDRTRWRSQI